MGGWVYKVCASHSGANLTFFQLISFVFCPPAALTVRPLGSHGSGVLMACVSHLRLSPSVALCAPKPPSFPLLCADYVSANVTHHAMH